MRCLHTGLTKASYDTLMKKYADIIISCGSSTASVNLLLSRENNAKSIIIMKPSFIGLNRFNLAIIPEHDNPPATGNIVTTNGALNLIDENSLKASSDILKAKIAPLKKTVIGLLLGGDTKRFKMGYSVIKGLLDELIKAADRYDADILVTTSRRTPGKIEELLRERLSSEPRCRVLVIANDKNSSQAVEAILGLSNAVLVSEESISMISEAASSRCYTIVFTQGNYSDKRHLRFLKGLCDRGFISIVNSRDIYNSVSNILSAGRKQPVLDNSVKVKEALKKIL